MLLISREQRCFYNIFNIVVGTFHGLYSVKHNVEPERKSPYINITEKLSTVSSLSATQACTLQRFCSIHNPDYFKKSLSFK